MDFPELLGRALKDRRLTHKSFAKLVDVSPGFISQCASGHSKPPLDRIDAWADRLQLSGMERAQFLEAAHLRHAPVIVAAQMERLRDLAAAATEAIDAKLLDDRRRWLLTLTDEELHEYPPFISKWRNALVHGDNAEETEHALRQFARIPAPIGLDGAVDFRSSILDPIQPLARWHKERADAALRELERLRAEMRRILGAVEQEPPHTTELTETRRRPAFQIPLPHVSAERPTEPAKVQPK